MFDLKTWDGFSELSRENTDYLLDTTALNKKMADRAENPYRWRVGSFQISIGCVGSSLEKAVKDACHKFVLSMEKQGWTLVSKLQVYKAHDRPAYDIALGVPLLDMREFRVRGIFKTNPVPVRIELPPSSVRQSPDQKASLEEVMRGEGITPMTRKERESLRSK